VFHADDAADDTAVTAFLMAENGFQPCPDGSVFNSGSPSA
jgi:hypothetical protein